MPSAEKDIIEHVRAGLVMCNIGAGKGKTTAAMGTCVRAAGAGLNVYILQFVKSKVIDQVDRTADGEWPLSAEIDYFNELEKIIAAYKSSGGGTFVGTIQNEQVGLGFVGILGDKKEKAAHAEAAREGLAKASEILTSSRWDVVFLDELISAVEVGVLTVGDVVELIKKRPPQVHLLLTGHNKYDEILAHCDLVTEMKLITHPYHKGVLAQRGIDY